MTTMRQRDRGSDRDAWRANASEAPQVPWNSGRIRVSRNVRPRLGQSLAHPNEVCRHRGGVAPFAFAIAMGEIEAQRRRPGAGKPHSGGQAIVLAGGRTLPLTRMRPEFHGNLRRFAYVRAPCIAIGTAVALSHCRHGTRASAVCASPSVFPRHGCGSIVRRTVGA